jgi:hypothetical protein
VYVPVRVKLSTADPCTEGQPQYYAGAPPRDPYPTPPDPDFGMTTTGAVWFIAFAAFLVLLHWSIKPCVR